jgi:molecular chaperone DnaK
VLQGEREMAGDNRTLGKFHLPGIPAAPRGVPQIEVTFDIDANGILNVSAKDLGTGKEQKITVTSSSGLSSSEIGNMVSNAAAHADEDRDRRKRIDARNQLDSVVYQTEKVLEENRSSIDAAAVSKIETALSEAKDVLGDEGADTARLTAAAEKVQQASHAMAEAMYRSAGNGEPGAGANAGTADEEEVLEAEVVEDDES